MDSNKQNIEKGFSKISHHYEKLDKTSSLINWMRKKVRNHLHKELKPASKILEINYNSTSQMVIPSFRAAIGSSQVGINSCAT